MLEKVFKFFELHSMEVMFINLCPIRYLNEWIGQVVTCLIHIWEVRALNPIWELAG